MDIEELQNKAAQVTIKFNAWHKEQKKMYLAKELGQDQMTIMPDGRGFVNVSGDHLKLSEIDNGRKMIPLQYTNRTDKDGVELFQGDILKVVRGGTLQICPEVIEWSEYGWLPWEYEAGDSYYRLGDIEKIGNIFENPELLKEKENNG